MRGKIDDPQAWLNFARRDLARARAGISDQDPAYGLFFLQQAAEKCLKGKLVALGWELVKTHDLTALLEAGRLYGLDLDWFAESAERLTYEYFAERYPGDFDPPPSAAEVRGFLVEVEKLFAQLFPESTP
ncbi:MAG: HEPN domain-containing protein [Chloroflexi bacterium]|nr:HEPN domain-containing protein [Chloroflexota bacterium]